jgi:hypothetical protein
MSENRLYVVYALEEDGHGAEAHATFVVAESHGDSRGGY